MFRYKYLIPLFLSIFASSALHAQSQGKNRAVQVATAEVQANAIARSLRLIGNTRSENSVYITSEVSSKITHIYVKAGQKINKGEKLLELDSAIARAAVLESKTYYNEEVRKLAEFRKLNQRGALTKTQLDAQQASVNIAKARLDAAELKLNDHTLIAPFSATVGLIDVNLGQFVSVGQNLLHLHDLSAIQLDVNVPEQYISELNEDVNITVHSKAWLGIVFSGSLNAIDAEVDTQSLNFRARIDVGTQNARVIPGMLMEAKIDFAPSIVPTVPVQAIEYSGTKRFVYVVQPDSTVKRTEVKLGGRASENVEVIEGLELGSRIVKEGLVSIRDGVKIQDLSNPNNNRPVKSEE